MPLQRKLSRKERRKASQLEREREREAARITGSRVLHHDPYRYSSSFASITLSILKVRLKSQLFDLFAHSVFSISYAVNLDEVRHMKLIHVPEGFLSFVFYTFKWPVVCPMLV